MNNKLEQYLACDLTKGWERGIRLGSLLQSLEESEESYMEFLGSSEEEAVFSAFNVKRFVTQCLGKDKLETGLYYWIKETSEKGCEWEIAYLDQDREFWTHFGACYKIDEVFAVDLTPIIREETDEEE